MEIISTERLIIRQYAVSDKLALAELMSNYEVMRFSGNGPISLEQAQAQLQNKEISKYTNDDYGMWAIILRDTNQLIGMIGLTDLVIENESFVEISYRLHPAFWKKGYALEATTSLINYAFTRLNLDNVFAFIEPANVNSKLIAEKLGMSFKKQILFHEKVIDVYQLTNRSL